MEASSRALVLFVSARTSPPCLFSLPCLAAISLPPSPLTSPSFVSLPERGLHYFILPSGPHVAGHSPLLDCELQALVCVPWAVPTLGRASPLRPGLCSLGPSLGVDPPYEKGLEQGRAVTPVWLLACL